MLPVCYRQITQLGDTTTNYQVMPGDRIYVATRTFCESFCQKRACPLCQGVQCPCPSSSALLPALPTVTPPRIIRGESPLPAEGEIIPDMPTVPDEMPTAPDIDQSPERTSAVERAPTVIRP